jgi:hypothetical protein
MAMATVIYDSFMEYALEGDVLMDTDTFYVMLVLDAYTPNKATHNFRDDVTNEVATGGGYTADGKAVTVTTTLDTTNHRYDIEFADTSWTTSTITARGCVIYKRRGGASSADELICAITFGTDVSTTGGTFLIDFTGPLRFQN